MLKEKLEQLANSASTRIASDKLNVMKQHIKWLEDTNFTDGAIGIGGTIPNITLLNSNNKEVNIIDLLKQSPTIIVFYRGTWCPYCNLQLNAYKTVLENEPNVNMIAISPELPDSSSGEFSDSELPFTVLSDVNNKLAKALKLLYPLSPELAKVYLDSGIDLVKSQGNNENSVPLAATYIVDTDSKIVDAWITADYKVRAEPIAVINKYKSLFNIQ